MKNTPLVSIIIPCYNCEKYVAETLNSVFEQDYPNIEVIVVNDGSTDNSESIVTNYSNINKRFGIKLINKPNGGLPAARNSGAEIATGKYFVFLDSDDKIHHKYISSCVAVMEADCMMNIVYAEASFFDAKKEKWDLPDFEILSFLKQNSIYCSAMIRNKVFKKVGGYDETLILCEDWDLWIRIIKYLGGVYRIPKIMFYYRKRLNQSSMLDNSNELIDENIKWLVYQKHYNFYRQNGLGLQDLIRRVLEMERYKIDMERYKNKYYSIWYKKIFYSIKRRK